MDDLRYARTRRLVDGACLALALGIAVASVVAGAPEEAPGSVRAELAAGLRLAIQPPVLVTLLERVLTFLPLGLLSGIAALLRPRRPVLMAGLLLLGFALANEALQLAAPGRHARLSDMVLGAAFGLVGLWLAVWLGKPPAAPRLRLLRRAILFAGSAVVVLMVVQAQHDAQLAGWACSDPLLIANELTGDRPWRGSVRGVALYDQALGAPQVAAVSALPFAGDAAAARRADAGAVLLYDFGRAEAGRIPELLTGDPSLDLMLPSADRDAWSAQDAGLHIAEPVLVRSAGAPRGACDAIVKAAAFSLEVEFSTGDSDQDGPARIVSSSTDTRHRNFTLGQDRGALVLRVRSPWNGPNGDRRPLRVEAGLGDGATARVVATYGAGTVRLFEAGRQLGEPLHYHELIWLGGQRFVRVAHLAALAFFLLGVVAGLGADRRQPMRRAGAAYAWIAAPPLLATVACTLTMGSPSDPALYVAAVAAPGLGLCLGALLTAVCRHAGMLARPTAALGDTAR